MKWFWITNPQRSGQQDSVWADSGKLDMRTAASAISQSHEPFWHVRPGSIRGSKRLQPFFGHLNHQLPISGSPSGGSFPLGHHLPGMSCARSCSISEEVILTSERVSFVGWPSADTNADLKVWPSTGFIAVGSFFEETLARKPRGLFPRRKEGLGCVIAQVDGFIWAERTTAWF